MDTHQERIQSSLLWVTTSKPRTAQQVVATRDVMRARLDRLFRELLQAPWPESDASLVTAVAGEIAYTCFDHNLGQWRDQPGCWFDYVISHNPARVWVLIADRGQGVHTSLRRVDPSIKTDQDALEVAFSKVISGRSPEKRGNGLKFVSRIVNGDSKRGLLFLSGTAKRVLGHLGPILETECHLPGTTPVSGTWALFVGETS